MKKTLAKNMRFISLIILGISFFIFAPFTFLPLTFTTFTLIAAEQQSDQDVDKGKQNPKNLNNIPVEGSTSKKSYTGSLQVVPTSLAVAPLIENSPKDHAQIESERSEKIKEDQLKSYQPITRWLIDNQSNFEKVITETSQKTHTKWFIKEDAQPINQGLQTIDQPITQVSPDITQKDNLNFPIEDASAKEKFLIFYTVNKGDTIYSISRKFEVDAKELLYWNNFSSSTQLKANGKIKIYTAVNLELNASENQIGTPLLAKAPLEPLKQAEGVIAQPVAPSVAVEGNSLSASQGVNSVSTKALEGAQPLSAFPEYKYYRVQKGDTLSSIAKAHTMTVPELLNLNNINNATPLSVGLILKVKSNYTNTLAVDTANSNNIVKDGFLWPVVGRLLIPFGPQSGGTINEGINISVKKGVAVKATQDGIVTYVGDDLKSFGNIVLVQHDNNWVSAYAHLDKIKVTKGQRLTKGEILGAVGTSGGVIEPQLHFELRYNIKAVDPLSYLTSYR
ncbi:Murein hydrolase activator NlpD precursor [Candidatus Hepatincolaceae symbiont of Richtersius coronifer]